MALPLWMLKDLKVTKYQKVGLGLIFSLATFCVILDLIRTVQAVAQNQVLYTILEINVVVIISCLPTYRALFTISHNGTSYRLPKLSTWTTIGRSSRSKGESRVTLDPNAIHVTNGYVVSNEERGSYSVEPRGIPRRDLILPEPAHSLKPLMLPPYCSPV